MINKNLINLIIELKKNGIKDTRVLNAIEKIPRNLFLESSIKSKSYLNIALPIDCGQTISQPIIVAHMTQALELSKKHRILEIGTGSGYQTSILSLLTRFVYTTERYKSLKLNAEQRFKKLKLTNVFSRHSDGGLGWKEQAPFEKIIVTAAAPEVPKTLIDQLSNDGVMVIPIGEENTDQDLVKLTKQKQRISSKKLMSVRFVPLLEGKNNL